MNEYFYDLHMHSCLSPCGDNDMTPNNMAGMGVLNGLNIMALTDHNTCKNCPAFFKAAKKNGIIPVAGMELTTAEDIHVICLFERLEDAMAFDAYVDERRSKIPNRVDIFGEQLIMDENDEVIGHDDCVLSFATTIPIDSVVRVCAQFDGFAYPAHVDRESNGAIAVLGDFPADCGFTAAEFHDGDKIEDYEARYPALRGLTKIVSSDAHYLWLIKEKKESFLLDDEPYSSDKVRHELFRHLRAGGIDA